MNDFKFCPMCKTKLRIKLIEDKKRLSCNNCGWIRYRNPLPVAQCVARNKEGKTVIIKRDVQPGKGHWALPGGFIEGGENPRKACLRDLKEETGWKGKVMGLLGVYTQKDELYGPVIIIGYEVMLENEDFEVRGEVKEIKLVDRENMPEIYFSSHRKILKDFYKRTK